MRTLLLLLTCSTITNAALGQVTFAPVRTGNLADRITSAAASGLRVGYSIRCVMESRSFVSSAWRRSTTERSERTLEACLADAGDAEAVHGTGGELPARSDVRISKRLAILVRHEGGVPTELEYQTTDLPYDSASGPVVWIGPASSTESTEWLAALVEKNSSLELRLRAVRLLGWHEEARTTASIHLRRWLVESDDPEVRRRASEALGALPSDENLAALSRAIRTDRSASVAKSCVWALGAQESTSATDTLLALLADPSVRVARAAVVQAVAHRASTLVLPALVSAVEEDPDPDVRRMAVFGMAQMKDGRGVQDLIQLAEESTSPLVRRAAIQALAQTGHPKAEEALIRIVRASSHR